MGVYWRAGRLLQGVTEPGLHLRLPYLDTYAAIQVTLQTDKVTDVPCGTKGGVMIYFARVEVSSETIPKDTTLESYHNVSTGCTPHSLLCRDCCTHACNQAMTFCVSDNAA